MIKQKGNDSLTIDILGVKVWVDFNYTPGESGYREFMGSGGNPPESEEIEIIAVYCKDVDITPLFIESELLEILEEKILNYNPY